MKKLIALILIIALLSLPLMACGENNDDDDYNYDNTQYSEGLEFELISNGNAYQVTGIGTCQDKEIFIPRSYNGNPVVYIADSAFINCTFVEKFLIPNSVTFIAKRAFSGCTSLKSVTILRL